MWVKSFTGSYGVPRGSAGATAWDATPETTSVYPSGAALATASEPITPPAPGRFSTMKFSLRLSASFCATMRPSVSALPPGANGATIRTGLAGHDCAAATFQKKATPRNSNRRFMQGFYNQCDEREHRCSYARSAGELSRVRRARPRCAVALDGRGARLPPARDDLGQGLPHRSGRLLERSAAHRGHEPNARGTPGALADARAPVVLAAARGRKRPAALYQRPDRGDGGARPRAFRRPRGGAAPGCRRRASRAGIRGEKPEIPGRRNREPRERHLDRRCALRAVLCRRRGNGRGGLRARAAPGGPGPHRRAFFRAVGVLSGRHRARLRLDDHGRSRGAAPAAAHRVQPRRRRDGDAAATAGARVEDDAQGEGIACRIAGGLGAALLLRPAGVRSGGGAAPDRALRLIPYHGRQRLPIHHGRFRPGRLARGRRARQRHPLRPQCRERAPLSRAEMICGSTALIDSLNTASAASSKGVGSALTITIFAPARRAMSTAPAIG